MPRAKQTSNPDAKKKDDDDTTIIGVVKNEDLIITFDENESVFDGLIINNESGGGIFTREDNVVTLKETYLKTIEGVQPKVIKFTSPNGLFIENEYYDYF